MDTPSTTSHQLEQWFQELQRDALQNEPLRARIIAASQGRLERLTRHLLRHYPALQRWEQTDDILQNALLRLYRALATTSLTTASDFYQLAGTLIRRELISLIRHHFGPLGPGRHHHTDPPRLDGQGGMVTNHIDPRSGPASLEEWSAFHEAVERLPAEEQHLMDLLWYEGLTQEQAAELLGVSLRTVKSRWREIKLHLRRQLNPEGEL